MRNMASRFTCYASGIWWIPHLFDNFYGCMFEACFTKNVLVRAWKFENDPYQLYFGNFQTTGCYTSSVKITTKYSKKDFLVWIIFYVHAILPEFTVHQSWPIFQVFKCLFITKCNGLFQKQCICFYEPVQCHCKP